MSAVKRTARLAAALGTATALAVGLAATPAQADDIPGVLTARLTITKEAAGCRVLTFGKVGMTQAQAQYLVDNGARAQVEIWGEDAVYDNRLYRAGALDGRGGSAGGVHDRAADGGDAPGRAAHGGA
ncbi:hypothetical protein, partial [Streptosporangium sp. NPDC048865]|uniref:hypothetical protein n=1 Tax=Streptosporangium sp. NPDC048865 TaxID=3155766 RepID=UPI00341E981C